MRMIGLLNWLKRRDQTSDRFGGLSWFAPYFSNRSRASAAESPAGEEEREERREAMGSDQNAGLLADGLTC
jgi:hypothetical protein